MNEKKQFEGLSSEVQLSLLQNYLTKLAFKASTFAKHVDFLKNLMSKVSLKKDLLGHPRMKQMVISFLETLKRFSLGRFDKFFIAKIELASLNFPKGPVPSTKECLLFDQRTLCSNTLSDEAASEASRRNSNFLDDKTSIASQSNGSVRKEQQPLNQLNGFSKRLGQEHSLKHSWEGKGLRKSSSE